MNPKARSWFRTSIVCTIDGLFRVPRPDNRPRREDTGQLRVRRQLILARHAGVLRHNADIGFDSDYSYPAPQTNSLRYRVLL